MCCPIIVATTATAQNEQASKSPIPNMAIDWKVTPTGKQQRSIINVGLWGSSTHLRGISLNAIGHLTMRKTVGTQLSGISNITRGKMEGVQVAGIFNYAGKIQGFQISSLLNISSQSAGGTQIAGISNITISGKGITQLALSNIVQKDMKGVQIGAANYAGSLSGVQLGVINIAAGEHLRGVQIGLMNVSQDSTSFKIGLVNISPITRIQAMLFVGSQNKINLGFRFRNRHFYTLLGAGLYYEDFDDKLSGSLFYRVGLHYPLRQHWRISGDIGYAHIEQTDGHTGNSNRKFALQSRVNIEYQWRPKLGFFFSAGHSMARRYASQHSFAHRPILEAGVLLF